MNRNRKIAVATALLMSLGAASMVSAAKVDGCDVTLTGSGNVTIYGGADGGFSDYQVDGSIDLNLASGDYTAEWEDGSTDAFSLSCDDAAIAVDPDPDPTVGPDDPDPEETAPPEPVEIEVTPEPTPTPVTVEVVYGGRVWMFAS
jgi:hypothetical protein